MQEPTFADTAPLKLWLVTGREYGADDDSFGLLWAHSEEEAMGLFVATTLDLSEEALAEHSDNNPQYFIVHTQVLGSGTPEQFRFDPVAQQEMVWPVTPPAGPHI